MEDTNIFEIENTSCVRNFMRVTPVFGIEREPWGEAFILRKVNDGVYICIGNVKSDEYYCWTKHAFVYDSNFKPLHQSKGCGALIDNRSDAPICVLEDKDRGNVMRVNPLFGTEIEPWVAACILRKVNDGVYICICNVKPDEYKC